MPDTQWAFDKYVLRKEQGTPPPLWPCFQEAKRDIPRKGTHFGRLGGGVQCSAVGAAPAWCKGHAQAPRENGWRGKEIYGAPTARRVLS